MMGLGRERRLNCRLYVDRQSDAKVVEKLDRLLVEKHFLNQTELIKHGIELVYREVYKEGSRANSTYMSGERLQKLAEVVSGELKPELRLLLEGAEARILEKIDSVKVNSVMVGETDNVPGVVGVSWMSVLGKKTSSTIWIWASAVQDLFQQIRCIYIGVG